MAFRDSLKKYREAQNSQPANSSASSKATDGTNQQSTSKGSSFRDSLTAYRISKISSADGWAETSLNLINDIDNRTKSWYDNNEYASHVNNISTLLSKADAWRKEYAGNDEAIAYIDSVVDALVQTKSYSYSKYKYYSQWENAGAYNEHNNKLNYNLDEARKEIEEIKKALLDAGFRIC